MDMITTDEYFGYKTAILNNYGVLETEPDNNTKKLVDQRSLSLQLQKS